MRSVAGGGFLSSLPDRAVFSASRFRAASVGLDLVRLVRAVFADRAAGSEGALAFEGAEAGVTEGAGDQPEGFRLVSVCGEIARYDPVAGLLILRVEIVDAESIERTGWGRRTGDEVAGGWRVVVDGPSCADEVLVLAQLTEAAIVARPGS